MEASSPAEGGPQLAAELFRAVLPVHDLERADAFWSKLLDLAVDPSVPLRHYIRTGGAILTLVDTAEHASAHGHEAPLFHANPDWIYFRVPDLDATWARAKELGCPPARTGEGAGIAVRERGERSFYSYDPFGNPFCFIDDVRSDTTPEKTRYMGSPIASLADVVLPTTNMGRAQGFYEELLGVDADASVPNRHVFYLDSCQLSLVNPAEHAHGLDEAPFRPNPEILYFAVPDLDASWERAQKLGMRPLAGDPDVGNGIQTHPWGERSFYGLDPSGNPISCVDDQTLYRGRG